MVQEEQMEKEEEEQEEGEMGWIYGMELGGE